jgi:hypothetical protein
MGVLPGDAVGVGGWCGMGSRSGDAGDGLVYTLAGPGLCFVVRAAKPVPVSPAR